MSRPSLLVVVTLLFACEGQRGRAGDTPRIFGGLSFDEHRPSMCTPARQAAVRAAVARGRTAVMLSEVGAYMLYFANSWYRPCYARYCGFANTLPDPFADRDAAAQASKMVEVARSLNSMRVRCLELDGADGHAGIGSYSGEDPEEIELDIGFIDRLAIDGLNVSEEIDLARVIWHEVAHQHAYRHEQSVWCGELDCGQSGYDADEHSANEGLERAIISAMLTNRVVLRSAAGNRGLEMGPGRYFASRGDLGPDHLPLLPIMIGPATTVRLCADEPAAGAPCATPLATHTTSVRNDELWIEGFDSSSVRYLEVTPQVIAFASTGFAPPHAPISLDARSYDDAELAAKNLSHIGSLFIPSTTQVCACTGPDGGCDGTTATGSCRALSAPDSDTRLTGRVRLAVEPRAVLCADPRFAYPREAFPAGQYTRQRSWSLGSLLVHPGLAVTIRGTGCDCGTFTGSIPDLSALTCAADPARACEIEELIVTPDPPPAAAPVRLTVDVNEGIVSISPPGQRCRPPRCETDVAPGTVVTLRAESAATVNGWTGCDNLDATGTVCTVTLWHPRAVSLRYESRACNDCRMPCLARCAPNNERCELACERRCQDACAPP